jgi:hypothetical protein
LENREVDRTEKAASKVLSSNVLIAMLFARLLAVVCKSLSLLPPVLLLLRSEAALWAR